MVTPQFANRSLPSSRPGTPEAQDANLGDDQPTARGSCVIVGSLGHWSRILTPNFKNTGNSVRTIQKSTDDMM